jgi:ketosteroid isomerase-like protein
MGLPPGELQDRAEITDVLNRYASGIRVGDVDDLVSCFTEDAYLDYGHVTMRGADEVRQYFSRITTPEAPDDVESQWMNSGRLSTPVVTNVVIELDGSGAHCESMCLAIHVGYREGEGRVVVRGTRNVDEFARTAAGWRIRARRHEALWNFEVPGTLLVPQSDRNRDV